MTSGWRIFNAGTLDEVSDVGNSFALALQGDLARKGFDDITVSGYMGATTSGASDLNLEKVVLKGGGKGRHFGVGVYNSKNKVKTVVRRRDARVSFSRY